MTTQQKLQAKLSETGIPNKQIRVYGSQIMITCIGKDSASKFHGVLTNICRTIRMNESLDELPNKKYQKVWRVWGTI